MQTNKEAEQVTLSDLGICCGKMFQEPSPAELPKARTSVLVLSCGTYTAHEERLASRTLIGGHPFV